MNPTEKEQKTDGPPNTHADTSGERLQESKEQVDVAHSTKDNQEGVEKKVAAGKKKNRKRFNHKCPLCGSVIRITSARLWSNTPISPMGWRIQGTHQDTNGTEEFHCNKCDSIVPCLWIYSEMSQTEASRLMRSWGVKCERKSSKRDTSA